MTTDPARRLYLALLAVATVTLAAVVAFVVLITAG